MKIRQLIAGGAVILSMLLCQPVLAEEVGYIQCNQGYVNIRNSASLDGKVVGKIYNNGQVYVQDTVNDWMQIRSGNVEGFIKSDFVIVEGDAVAAKAKEAAYNTAYVYPETLIVRAQPSTESQELYQLHAGEEVEVVDKVNGWAKVCINLNLYGYISEYYISYHTYYGTAEPFEEPVNSTPVIESNTPTVEEPIKHETSYEEEYIPDVNQEEQQVEDTYTNSDYVEEPSYDYDYGYEEESQDDSYYEEPSYDYNYEENYEEESSYEEPSYDYEEPVYEEEPSYNYEEPAYTEEDFSYEEEEDYSSSDSSSGDGSYLSQYAQQYIGNPYVWGGTSLETGADCSGFTLAVLAANGITVNGRTAADQAAGGTQVSLDEAQAGDLIYYSDDNRGIYHIAIYNGDGTVTHSSSTTTGVTISDMNYSGNASGAVRYW